MLRHKTSYSLSIVSLALLIDVVPLHSSAIWKTVCSAHHIHMREKSNGLENDETKMNLANYLCKVGLIS